MNKDKINKQDKKTTSLTQVDTLLLSCNGGKKTFLHSKDTRRYIELATISHCLVGKGFRGDEESNRQLALIIKMVKCDGFSQVFNKDHILRFRGDLIFKVILELKLDDDCVRTPDGHCGMLTKTSKILTNAVLMINNIEGVSPVKYLNGKIFTSSEKYIEIVGETPMKKYGNLTSKYLKEAYESGKIVLKEYGEE